MNPIPSTETCPVFRQLDPCASELRKLAHFPAVEEIDRIIAPRAGVRFEEAPPKPRRKTKQPIDPARLYDGAIVRGTVPTRRQNLHDLFNALVWATFPASKRALHARQHRIIDAVVTPGSTKLPGARTREQDTLAMLDEGGVIVACAPGSSSDVVRELTAKGLAELHPFDPDLPVLVFGHALFEAFATGTESVMALAVAIEVADRASEGLAARCDPVLSGMVADPERFLDPRSGFGVRLRGDQA